MCTDVFIMNMLNKNESYVQVSKGTLSNFEKGEIGPILTDFSPSFPF